MIPLCFEYLSDAYPGQTVYITIIGQFTHHFSGCPVYRVREEYANGSACETLYTESYMKHALSNRVDRKD